MRKTGGGKIEKKLEHFFPNPILDGNDFDIYS